MKIFLLIFFCGFYFLGCSSQPEKEKNTASKITQRDSAKVILMTPQTELRSAEYLTASVRVPGIVCRMCEDNIKTALKKLDGIIKVNASHKRKEVSITFDGGKINLDKIRKTISKAGYNADDVKRDPAAYEALDDCCKMQNTKES